MKPRAAACIKKLSAFNFFPPPPPSSKTQIRLPGTRDIKFADEVMA
jgi:hypothetical protein